MSPEDQAFWGRERGWTGRGLACLRGRDSRGEPGPVDHRRGERAHPGRRIVRDDANPLARAGHGADRPRTCVDFFRQRQRHTERASAAEDGGGGDRVLSGHVPVGRRRVGVPVLRRRHRGSPGLDRRTRTGTHVRAGSRAVRRSARRRPQVSVPRRIDRRLATMPDRAPWCRRTRRN